MAKRGAAESRMPRAVAWWRASAVFVALFFVVMLVPAVNAYAEAEAAQPGEERAALAADELLMNAMGLIGTPYRRRGNSPAEGFDCSGFVGYVFARAHGQPLPRSARDIYALGDDRASHVPRDSLLPGDLIFFRIGHGRRIDHVALYLGEQRFVHAPATGGEVRIDTLDLPYWQRRYAGARRILAVIKPALSLAGDNPADAAAVMAADAAAGAAADDDVVARDLGELTAPADNESLPPEN